MRIRSFRLKLQLSFVGLGLLAIAVTGWQAWLGSTGALRQATEERLTAIRETKRQLLESYFRDASHHVLALSSDEATIIALESLRAARRQIPVSPRDSLQWARLHSFYKDTFAPTIAHAFAPEVVLRDWFPRDPRTVTLQDAFISSNPHPMGAKDLLLSPPDLGNYGVAHARFHPTFHRYQTAFGCYDIFVIDAVDGSILYSVFKETDFGHSLKEAPYADTALARAFHAALALDQPEQVVIEDYERYIASHMAPAAFLAAPIWRAGAKTGVLAIQVSANAVNQVLSGSAQWRAEGLGESGNVYLVGTDGVLRSDLRFLLEDPTGFLKTLENAGGNPAAMDRIRRDGTSILSLTLAPEMAEQLRNPASDSGIGTDFRGVEVFRAWTPLDIPGLNWRLVAEMSTEEAFDPLRLLSLRTFTAGAVVAALFLVAAWLLGDSVTRPVLRLAEGARRLGERDFGVHLPVTSSDELGELAQAFNRMATNLERTTVSRDELDVANRELRQKRAELEVLTDRLIHSQETERARLARELHDDFTQRIASLAIRAGTLKKLPPEVQAGALNAELTQLQTGLSALGDDLHGLSRRLHPSVLDELGLVAAIEGECRGFFERGGPVVELDAQGDFEALSAETQLALYRIVQESLRNCFRHAEATEAEIELRRENGNTTLRIRDDGKGFSRSDENWKPGLGLASMMERARLLGGQCEIDSSPGRGCTIVVIVPESTDSDARDLLPRP